VCCGDVAVHDGLQLAGQAPLIALGKLIVSGNSPMATSKAMTPTPANISGPGRRFRPPTIPQLASWGGQKPDGCRSGYRAPTIRN